jgi:hypothetical protein
MSDEIKSLADFYGEMSSTGLRLQHQFQLQFFPSEAALSVIVAQSSQAAADALRNVSYWVEATAIPGVELAQAEIKYLGTAMVIPTTTTFAKTITVALRCDAQSLVRNALLAWRNFHSNINLGMNQPLDIASSGGGNKKIPASSAKLNLYNDDLSAIVESYKLFGAFPTNVAQMVIDQTASDVAKFDLTLMFQYFQVGLEG